MTSECTHHQLFFKGSMDARSLEHEGTMVEVYSKMKPDTFQVTVANCLDRLLREDQEGCECQRLHQVLGGQAQVRGPDLRQTPTQPTPPTGPRRRQRRHPRYPARRERGSRTRRGGASSCPQPWGQGRGRQGGEGGRGW
jgi:hypothetical protein